MGGCCCSARRAQWDRVGLEYQQCSWSPVEQDPFPLHHRFTAISPSFLTDSDLEISEPEMLQAPRPPSIQLVCMTNNVLDPQAGGDIIVSGRPCGDLKGPVMKTLRGSLSESQNFSEEKNSKLEPIPFVDDEEEFCPTCLEEYDKENPKIITNCGHHFHLSCILEWMERSETCPMCNQDKADGMCCMAVVDIGQIQNKAFHFHRSLGR